MTDKSPTESLRATARCSFPPGHVIHMSLDHRMSPSQSVAACDCGWSNRVDWVKGCYTAQDAAVETHWAEVEAGDAAP